MSYLNKLKNSNQDQLRKLTEAVSKLNSPSERTTDEDYWTPTVDKVGNGSAIIRWLPPVEDEEDYFVKYYDYSFQHENGRWYIEKSLRTFGEPDPVYTLNGKLYRESDNKDSPQRKQASAQKQRQNFVSNILVIKDPGNPENNGKVFKFRYGKKLYDKWQEQVFPPIDDLTDKPMWEACNPFDLFNGKDFYIRIRQVSGFRNYDQSSFGEVRPVSEDEDELEAILAQLHPLKPLVDRANYKTYEELEKRLNYVLGEDEARSKKRNVDEDLPRQEPSKLKEKKSSFDLDDEIPFLTESKSNVSDDDDDDDMSFFAKLRDED
jgi:hypothetical protein